MRKTEVREKTLECINNMFKDSQIENETRFIEDLKMSFKDMIVLGDSLEESLEIKLSCDDLKEMLEGSVEDMVDFIYDFLKPFTLLNEKRGYSYLKNIKE